MDDAIRLGDYVLRRTHLGWAAHRAGLDHPHTWVDPFPSWPGHLLNLALAEIERLRAALEDAEHHDDLRQIEVERLQALIDAYAEAEFRLREDTVPLGPEWRAVKASYNAAEDALLAAATKKEDDRD